MNSVSAPSDGPSVNKIWLASYPDSVPAELPPLEHASLAELLEESCTRYANRLAFTSMGKSITYRDLDTQTRKIGAWLQSLGLHKGDRVAVMMPNVLQNPVVVYGILRAGFVVVNVNPLYTPRELEHQLQRFRRQGDLRAGKFRPYGRAGAGTYRCASHVVVTTMGDMLGLKGQIVNFVVRKVKKLVPAWSLPGHRTFKAVLAEGARLPLKPVDVIPAAISPSCNIPAARPASPRARC